MATFKICLHFLSGWPQFVWSHCKYVFFTELSEVLQEEGSKNSPLATISFITAGGIMTCFVIVFVAYRVCRNKRNTGNPFFGKCVHNFPTVYTLINHSNDAKLLNTQVHSRVESRLFLCKVSTSSRLLYDGQCIGQGNCCGLVH